MQNQNLLEQTDIETESAESDRNKRNVETKRNDNMDALKTAKAMMPSPSTTRIAHSNSKACPPTFAS